MIVRHSSGFTIIELMVSLSLLAVLAALAAPSMAQFVNKQRISSQAQVIGSAFSVARSEAINRSVNVFVCWNPSNSAISVTIDGTAQAIQVDELVVVAAGIGADPSQLVQNVIYTDNRLFISDDEVDNCVNFSPQGRLVGATGSNLVFGVCEKSGEDAYSRSITVNVAGRARVQDNDGETYINCS